MKTMQLIKITTDEVHYEEDYESKFQIHTSIIKVNVDENGNVINYSSGYEPFTLKCVYTSCQQEFDKIMEQIEQLCDYKLFAQMGKIYKILEILNYVQFKCKSW